MMRSDQLREFIKIYLNRDDSRFFELTNDLINDEEKKQHHLLASELRQLIQSQSLRKGNDFQSNQIKKNIVIPRDESKGFPLLDIKKKRFDIQDIIVNEDLKGEIVRLIDEQKNWDLLRTYGLKPRQKILFFGEPGTGKTMASYIISNELKKPLVHVRFDSIISSYLGETATNLRKVFDFIEHGDWVVLFDEFDFIAKKRDDESEHGEIKRVVNNFMQMLDNYSGTSLLIAATNHQYLLDVGVWRRFDDIIYFGMPDQVQRKMLFEKYLSPLRKKFDVKSQLEEFAALTKDFSPSDIQTICENSLRRAIVDNQTYLSSESIRKEIQHQSQKKKIIQR